MNNTSIAHHIKTEDLTGLRDYHCVHIEMLGHIFKAISEIKEKPGLVRGLAQVGAYLSEEFSNDADLAFEYMIKH